ncbi:MAG: PRC-barrel domain-containing protein [Desulfosalsimonadaceae bacterium]
MKKISITLIGLIAMLMLLAAPVYAEKTSAMNQGGEKATSSEKGKMTSAGEMTRQDAIQASSLMDREVQDAQGNNIGSVTDMMIGPDGNVAYIVLSQGDGILGLGEKDFMPVPWSKVNTGDIGKDQEALTLSLSKQELENAPAFTEEEWQAFLRGEKQQEVRGYYETQGARSSGQELKMKEKTGKEPGMNTGKPHEMKKKETERKAGEGKY